MDYNLHIGMYLFNMNVVGLEMCIMNWFSFSPRLSTADSWVLQIAKIVACGGESLYINIPRR